VAVRGLLLVLVVQACIVGEALGAEGLSYEEAMSASLRLEAEGRVDDAAAVLEAISARYLQDFRLVLRFGWLRFQQEKYASAEEAYGKALELSPSSTEALLGRAWCRPLD